ncbi:MAG: selenoneine biosynthesis selenosugar synthase SenB [Vulcanimicrobiaceae bacterium]
MPVRKHSRTIAIIAPTAASVRTGNAHTAARYAAFFRSAGWRVRLLERWAGEPCDGMVALHARKSARSALAFARAYPERPLVVVMTGTDLYRDIARSRLAQRAMQAARAIVTLQPDGIGHLPRTVRAKARAIVQSSPARERTLPRRGAAQVCVLGHLRYEKDPLRAAYALRALPRDAPIRVIQAGAALQNRFALAAERLAQTDARYRWLGEVTHARALRILQASDMLVLSSRMEGGANVLSEAIAAGVPVIASDISGNRGILGSSYPAYFPVGDTEACAALLERALHEPRYLPSLRRWIRELGPLVRPARERRLWLALLREVAGQ